MGVRLTGEEVSVYTRPVAPWRGKKGSVNGHVDFVVCKLSEIFVIAKLVLHIIDITISNTGGLGHGRKYAVPEISRCRSL